MDLIIIIGVVGSIASVAGLILALPTIKSKIVHVLYGLSITIITAGLVYYQQKNQKSEDFQHQAWHAYEITKNNNDDRAAMLMALAFLEKNKIQFPDTYAAVQKLCDKAGLLGKSESYELSLSDGARAVSGLLYGLSGCKENYGMGQNQCP